MHIVTNRSLGVSGCSNSTAPKAELLNEKPLANQATQRGSLVSIPTSGEDILSVDLRPAGDMTESQRRRGWGQIGAIGTVHALNTVVAAGVAVGLGAIGAVVLGPVGAVVGAIGGLVGGIAVGAFGESNGYEKPIKGLKNFVAKAGAKVGAALSAPLQKLLPKAVKEYQLGEAAGRKRISLEDIKGFVAKLQPGDVILSLSDDDPLFHNIVALEKKPLDFTHVMLYAGDGQIIEASADEGKVRRSAVEAPLLDHAQVVAIRPNYSEGEAQKVIDQAATYLGRPYDWMASLSDKRLGCVEVPYQSFKSVAPEFQVPVTKVWGIREFIFPSDYMELNDSKVVASAGFARPASKMAMARYAWAADRLD